MGATNQIINMENTERNSDEVSIKDLLIKAKDVMAFIKTKWLWLLILGVLGSGIGFFYAKFQKPKYTAKLTFGFVEGDSKGAGLGSLASSLGVDIGGGSAGVFSGDNLIELMKSSLLIEKTLLSQIKVNNKPQLLINRYIDFNKPKNPKPLKPGDRPAVTYQSDDRSSFSLEQDSFLALVSKKILKTDLLVSKKDKKLSIVNVSFTGEDQVFAKSFTQILTQTVTEFYIETKTGQMRRNIDKMEHKVDSIKIALNAAMYGAAAAVDQNQYLVRGIGEVPQVRKRLEIQVLSTMYAEMLKNLELSKNILAKEQPIIQLIDEPRFPLEKKKTGLLLGTFAGGFVSLLLAVLFFMLKRWWAGLNLKEG